MSVPPFLCSVLYCFDIEIIRPDYVIRQIMYLFRESFLEFIELIFKFPHFLVG